MNTISALSSDVHCRACEGTGIFIPAELLELEQEITSALSAFPNPDIMGKGQWFFKARSIVRTLAFMYHKGDIEGRAIACLASPTIAVGLLLLQKRAKIKMHVTILDIDADVLNMITSNFEGANVRLYNITNDCPEEMKGGYDCFFLDPLYAEDHYRVGLSRCVQLIGGNYPDRVGYVVVPPEEIAPIHTNQEGVNIPIQLAIFGFINSMGLCVADFKDNFMEYSTPPAEAGILKRRTLVQANRDSMGEWRGSDLVRVVSTASTHPLVVGETTLSKRVNDQQRVGTAHEYVPLSEISSADIACNLCPKCFSAHLEDQRSRAYSGYWRPEIYSRPMPSWRSDDDQPFEVAPSCSAFENTKTGDLVMLRGPAAKSIWETLRDLEGAVGNNIGLAEALRSSLPDYADLDQHEVNKYGLAFITELVNIGLLQRKKIEE